MKNKVNQILLIGTLALGMVCGGLLILFGFSFINKSYEKIIDLLIIISITGVFLLTFLWLYGEKIIRKYYNESLDKVESITSLIESSIKADTVENRRKSLSQLINEIAVQFFIFRKREIILSLTFSIFIGFAGILGSYLLYEQNKLISGQNQFLREQNIVVKEQFAQQMKFQQNSRKVELFSHLYEEDINSKGEKAIIEFFDNDTPSDLINQIPKSHSRIRYDALQTLIDIESPSTKNQLDLRKSFLNELDLTDINLDKININNSNCSKSTLSYFYINETPLNGINFFGTKFVDSTHFDLYFRDSLIFINCFMMEAEFYPSKVRNFVFEECIFSNTKYGGGGTGMLKGVKFLNGKFNGSFFIRDTLKNVWMEDILFEYCIFNEFSILETAELENVIFSFCSFINNTVQVNENVRMENVKFILKTDNGLVNIDQFFKFQKASSVFKKNHNIEFDNSINNITTVTIKLKK